MNTVWKTTLVDVKQQEIEVPKGAKMLHFAEQDDKFCVWYRCAPSPSGPYERRLIYIAATGDPIPDEPWRYIGTTLIRGGTLVFHAFERASG